jgi:hypothetical protein
VSGWGKDEKGRLSPKIKTEHHHLFKKDKNKRVRSIE